MSIHLCKFKQTSKKPQGSDLLQIAVKNKQILDSLLSFQNICKE